MDDRYNRYGTQDYGRDYGSGRDYTYSSARDYAASGEYGRGRRPGGYDRDGDDMGDRYTGGGRDYYGSGRDRAYPSYGGFGGYAVGGRGGSGERSRDWGNREDPRDRGFFERAGDELRSWFGDDEAERRREMDQRYDERQGRSERARRSHDDDHYHSWRRQRIAELDRDYDEYRRENAQRFESEFGSWRTERQGQRDQLRKVEEHMEVIGADGSHVGTVDKVRGDRIILTKSDSDAGGHHHSIPSRWIHSVDDKVTLRKTADEAKAHWRDEDRSGAMFGDKNVSEESNDWRSTGNLNRSFSGTY